METKFKMYEWVVVTAPGRWNGVKGNVYEKEYWNGDTYYVVELAEGLSGVFLPSELRSFHGEPI